MLETVGSVRTQLWLSFSNHVVAVFLFVNTGHPHAINSNGKYEGCFVNMNAMPKLQFR